MDVPSNGQQISYDAESSSQCVKKEYEAPQITDLGSLVTLSRTEVLFSVGGGEV